MKYRRYIKILDTIEDIVYLLLGLSMLMYMINSAFCYIIIFSYLCLAIVCWVEETFPSDTHRIKYSNSFIDTTMCYKFVCYFLLGMSYWLTFCILINSKFQIIKENIVGVILVFGLTLLLTLGFKKWTDYLYINMLQKDNITFLFRQRRKRLIKRVIVMFVFLVIAFLLRYFM